MVFGIKGGLLQLYATLEKQVDFFWFRTFLVDKILDFKLIK
jgi:hypothetical protein